MAVGAAWGATAVTWGVAGAVCVGTGAAFADCVGVGLSVGVWDAFSAGFGASSSPTFGTLLIAGFAPSVAVGLGCWGGATALLPTVSREASACGIPPPWQVTHDWVRE